MKHIDNYLSWMVENDGSDLYLTVGRPATLKVSGQHLQSSDGKVSSQDMQDMVAQVCNEAQAAEFAVTQEMNLGYGIPEVGRFRVNILKQRGTIAMVIRYVKSRIPTLEELHLPHHLAELALEKRGLILLTGAAGTGKSTTLAAMIDYRNMHMEGHIVTVEDPIEFLHEHKRSIVTQREVGIDTDSFAAALRNILRQAPDVILVGEMRDTETVTAAVNFAETGHLVLATLHSSTADQALERMLSFFPLDTHHQIFQQLSLELNAIVSLRLLPRHDGTGVIPAYEVLLNTPRIQELIERGEVSEIKSAMAASRPEGCITFDQCLYDLVKNGYITEEEALHWADSKNNLALKFKMEKTRTNASADDRRTSSRGRDIRRGGAVDGTGLRLSRDR
ncbi:MAG: PilT/PilU family type 4a pilus ATPase [Planctomycetes bacterium]|nr:PilT/PilU family type 4a pilus ATPase [Planctomycetota bacterium]